MIEFSIAFGFIGGGFTVHANHHLTTTVLTGMIVVVERLFHSWTLAIDSTEYYYNPLKKVYPLAVGGICDKLRLIPY